MDWRSIGIVSDPGGVLIGLLRRVFGGGHGKMAKRMDSEVLLRECHLFRHDERQLQALIDTYPNRPEPLVTRGMNLAEARDWEKLAATAIELRRRFPGVIDGYAQGANALRSLGRLDESEAWALAAMRRFPRSSAGPAAYATCAELRGDLDAAVRRWEGVRRRYPDMLWAWIRLSEVLARLGRMDEADDLAARAIDAFPKDVTGWTHHARLAERIKDWPAAAQRWSAGRAYFDLDPTFYARGAHALRLALDIQGAAKLITEAGFLFPHNKDLLVEREAIIGAGGDPGPLPPPRV